MNLRTIGATGCLVGVWLSFSACDGGTPAAETPTPASSGAAASSAAPPASPPSSESPPPASAGGDPDAPAVEAPLPKGKDGPKPSRAPHDVIGQSNTVFLLSFDDSDAKGAAETACASQAKDPKKLATCMSKERLKIEADGHGFKKEDEGKYTWTVIHRNGKQIVTLHKILVSQVGETENTIVLKPEGKDTGTKPGKLPGEFTVDVPSDYRIVITDPKLGKLVYEAKIGIINNP